MVERLAGKMLGRALALCFFFLLGCFPSVANAALDQWTAVGPIGQGANTLAIDGTNPSIIYAGRDNGVFKSTDSGSSWGAINSGLFFTVFGVPRVLSVAVDPSSPALYAGAAAPIGGMFKSTNGGASWNRIVNGLSLFTGPPAVLSIAIDRSNPSTLYVGTAHNGAFKSTDGGATWRAIAGALNDVQGFFMPPDVPALVIDPSNPSTLYAGTGESFGVGGRGIFKSIDAGANWLQINNGLPSRTRVLSLLIDGSSPSTLYAGTSGHGVFKSTDGGTSWRAINIGLTNFTVQALVMDPSNPSTLYAATNGQGVFRSSDSGANWSALNNGLTNLTALSLAIDPTSPSNLYAGGGGGVFKLVAGATDPPFTSDRDGDGLPLTAQVVEPPFSPEFRKYEGVAHKLTAFPAFTRSYRAIVRPLSQEKWLQLNDPSLGGLNMVTATTRMARYSSGQLIVFSGCKPHFCPNAEVAVAFNPVTGNTWALVRLEDNTSQWLGPENAEIRKILLSLLSEPPDTEPPLQGALTPKPADPDALLKVANEVATTIVKHSVDAGIGEVVQAVVAKLIVFIATSLPPEVAKQLTLNPRGLVGWAARITGKELVRDIAKVDPIGFALGVASEALVEFIRNEMPHSTTAQNFKIEGLALLIRESTVAYAYARGGMHAAVAAQTIVSGTTLFEAIQGGAELAWATYTQPQRDRRERIGAEFLTLRATFKAETNAERKAQALAMLDAFLAGPGRPLFEAFPDPDGQRKIYVCTLAKASNIEWQCA